VSACVSSLIPSAVRHPGRLGAMAAMSPQGLLEALSAVADPRKSRGVRHRFISILALCACAVLAGARSFIAIAEWAMDLSALLRAKLGVGRVTPCESTIRRVLQRVDPDVLDEAVSAWLAVRSPTRTGAAGVRFGWHQPRAQYETRPCSAADDTTGHANNHATVRHVRCDDC